MTEIGRETDFMAAASGPDLLGAALIDAIWGQQALPQADLTTTWVECDDLERLRRAADQLVEQIAEREAELRDRRSALDMFIARYFHAVSGLLDEVELIEEQVARTQADVDTATRAAAAARAAEPSSAPAGAGSSGSGAADWLNSIVPPVTTVNRATNGNGNDGAHDSEGTSADHHEVPGVWFSAEADLDDEPDDGAATHAATHTPIPEIDPHDIEPRDLRADYRRLAKLIAPDLGSIDDQEDQHRRTELMARLTAAYKQGNVASMAMIEFEIGGVGDADGREPLEDRIARLDRSCEAMSARLLELDAELAALDASSMDQLRRRAAERDGDSVLADMVAEMQQQIAHLRASLDVLGDQRS